MRKAYSLFVLLCGIACLNLSAAKGAAESLPAKAASEKSVQAKAKAPAGYQARLEQLMQRMLPQEKLDKAAAFFGPVTKKYMPVVTRFQNEYKASANKRALIRKYLPEAESALADAKTMKVPQKYEAEKNEYVKMGEAFLVMLKFSTAFGE